MMIEFKDDILYCVGVLVVEDVEVLLVLVVGYLVVLVDFFVCEYVYMVCLQVLMVSVVSISVWLGVLEFSEWLCVVLLQY